MKTYQENNVPIIITKNDYSETVMMSIKLYEEMFTKLQAEALINESWDDIENGTPLVNGENFFETIREKYRK